MLREPGEERIGQRLAAKEGHRDAAAVILINQNANMGATLERICYLNRRIMVGLNQLALVSGSCFGQPSIDA